MPSKTIAVRDRMQSGYKYVLTEPMGKNFDPSFKPAYAQLRKLDELDGEIEATMNRVWPGWKP